MNPKSTRTNERTNDERTPRRTHAATRALANGRRARGGVRPRLTPRAPTDDDARARVRVTIPSIQFIVRPRRSFSSSSRARAMRPADDADDDARERDRSRRRRRLAFDYASQTERPPRAASFHRGERVARASLPLVALVLVVVSVALARALASVSSRARGFSGFFRAIDGDGDGELTTRELRRYFDGVGGRDLDERREVARAARATVETMDTEDEGMTVNLRELRRAARGMASARDVGEWVGRGVGYPEYAEAFVDVEDHVVGFSAAVGERWGWVEEDGGV